MKIKLNEITAEIGEGTTLGEVAQRRKPGADVLIVNGFPARPETMLHDGDSVMVIKRGESPAREELEAVMAARHTPGVHAKVRAATVGVAGLGGLGSHVAIALARLGVGRLVLADFDVVEPSNLNRQSYFVDQLGMEKAEALSATLARINPFVAVEARTVRITPENTASLFGECQVVVEAFDAADQKAMIVESVLAKLPGVFVVAASGLAGHGPAEDIKPHRLGPNLVVVGDLASEAKPGAGLMAPRVGVAAHMQANAVLRRILGED